MYQSHHAASHILLKANSTVSLLRSGGLCPQEPAGQVRVKQGHAGRRASQHDLSPLSITLWPPLCWVKHRGKVTRNCTAYSVYNIQDGGLWTSRICSSVLRCSRPEAEFCVWLIVLLRKCCFRGNYCTNSLGHTELREAELSLGVCMMRSRTTTHLSDFSCYSR